MAKFTPLSAEPRGPVPKRTEERRRRNKPEGLTRAPAVQGIVEAPLLAEDTAPLAREWYDSLKLSGQSQFYEPSDWLAAKFLAAQMTAHIASGYRSAVQFAAIWSAMGELLTTEGARRRVRLEIERAEPKQAPAGVTAIEQFRKRMQA